MRLLMFLKQKRDNTLKGRGCEDGCKQRKMYDKEEATSPTVALESVLLTATIDAHERRDVAIVEIPGAVLQANLDDDVWVPFDGTLADLMVKAAPKIYSKYVTINSKGKKVLYVKLKKALYGCLKSTILFYRKLASDLTKMGFTINFYDPCVANKMVGGKQLTVCWHVDDLKISHVNKHVVTKFIRRLQRLYGKKGKLTVSWGKRHDYLGMILDYTTPGKVKINMTKYVKETHEIFPDDLGGRVSSPAAEHLREVNPDAEKLDEGKKQTFHTITARSLFSGKRA